MKIRTITIIAAIVVFVSCGTKPSKTVEVTTNAIDLYVNTINGNTNLKQDVTEGALTDTQGFKDIGSFKYTVYYDAQTNSLSKIKNIETTADVLSESYYFKGDQLVLIETNSAGKNSQFYVQNNKIISGNKIDSATTQLLLEKAKQFQRAFKRAHE